MNNHKKPPTMSDVARQAGVSRMTVSAVFNGSKGNTFVSEATHRRVLEAAQQLGYLPNASALALRCRRTDQIGLFLGYPFDALFLFPATIINGIQASLQTYRSDLLIYNEVRQYEEDGLYVPLASRKIDGLILVPLPDCPMIEKLAKTNLPVIAVADAAPG